jgi:tetratricopeptide (TPR) repeat protein
VKRASRALCTASIGASFLLLSGSAFAADLAPVPETPGEQKSEPAGIAKTDPAIPAKGESAESASAADQAAAAAYERALSSYAQGDIKGAFDEMQESYRLSKRPELLYNLARLEDNLQDCQASLEDYRRYLERVPQGSYRQAAEQASAELGRRCPSADPTAPVAAAPTQPSEGSPASDKQKQSALPQEHSYWTTPRWIGWSAIAAGTLAGVGALYFRLAAGNAHDSFQQTVDNWEQARLNGSKEALDYRLQDQQHLDMHMAVALGVTGGALVAGGLFVLILDPQKREQTRANAQIFIAPGLLGACYSQHF